MAKFNYLVLLVGTNPLPNLVVLKYFLSKNNNFKVILIHTKETHKFAINIIEVVKLEKEKFVLINLKEEDNPTTIKNDIYEAFGKLDNVIGVHLNYTGGTKVMGIKVYFLLENYCKEKSKIFESSYLSARDFKLKITTANEEYNEIDLKNKVNISFSDLIKIHDFQLKDQDAYRITEIDFFEELINKRKLEYYTKNYDRKCFLNEKDELIAKKDELKNLFNIKNYQKLHEVVKEAMNRLPIEKQVFDKTGNLKEDKNCNNKTVKSLLKYLDGDWFEEFVTKKLFTELEKKNCKVEKLKNVILKKEHWRDGNFEIDALVIKGYELFGISITTSSEKYLCKSKGFEIIHRTKQIGGDEARQILITLAKPENVDKLRMDFEYETGRKNEQILVLGIDDIYDDSFIIKIKQFMEV
jgi:hypothetical protein